MASDSVSKVVLNVIQSNWSLGGALSPSLIHFASGWFDNDYTNQPQLTVSPSDSDPTEYFGPTVGHNMMHYISRDIYVVNIWLPIPSGSAGANEEQYRNQMREEVMRILVTQTSNFSAPLGRVLPMNRGRNLSEMNRTPRLLRFELPFWANYIY